VISEAAVVLPRRSPRGLEPRLSNRVGEGPAGGPVDCSLAVSSTLESRRDVASHLITRSTRYPRGLRSQPVRLGRAVEHMLLRGEFRRFGHADGDRRDRGAVGFHPARRSVSTGEPVEYRFHPPGRRAS
jgi:hypothetical protein